MLRFSKKVEYALIAMLHMASEDQHKLSTAKELSYRYHIPLELMGKVLQRLSKQGLVESVQGIKGGYKLKRPLAEISISEILVTVDGPLKLVNCLEKKDNSFCDQHVNCTIKNPMGVIQSRLESLFDELKLQDIEKDLRSVL